MGQTAIRSREVSLAAPRHSIEYHAITLYCKYTLIKLFLLFSLISATDQCTDKFEARSDDFIIITDKYQ